MAQSELASERLSHTLSATAMVNEVCLKLGKTGGAHSTPRIVSADVPPSMPPLDRGVFFGLAAQAMRRILVDHARTCERAKGTPLFQRTACEAKSPPDPATGQATRPTADPLSFRPAATLD